MATPQSIGDSTRAFPLEGRPWSNEFRPMTMDEYRARIDRSIEDYHAGRVISQEEMEKRVASWFSQ
jgi:hypothetical protein